MGFFSTSKKHKRPKACVESWTREDVGKWLTYLGMQKYSERFRAVTGKRLLQLSVADLYQLVDTKLDADLFRDAIQELHEPVTPDTPASMTTTDLNSGAADAFSSAAKPAASPSGTPSYTSASNGNGELSATAFASSGAMVSIVPEPSLKIKTSLARTSADYAEVLASCAGNADKSADVHNLLNFLGIKGEGLVDAIEHRPDIGHIFGAFWKLHVAAQNSKANRVNCQELDKYGLDILRIMDAEGKRLSFLDSQVLAQLLELVQQATELAEGCGRTGWLMLMARDEGSMDEFTFLHTALLEVLRGVKLDKLPTGRQLQTGGEYHDSSRALRRALKQLGSGNLDDGLRFIRQNTDGLAEIAQLISVEPQAILKEIEGMATLWEENSGHMTQRGASEGSSRGAEFKHIFNQYDQNSSGALEFDELCNLLKDVGMLDAVKPNEQDGFCLQQFSAADADKDDRIGWEDFCLYYQAISMSPARQEIRAGLGEQAEQDLKKIFGVFASFGTRQVLTEMEGAKFSKLCKDCKLYEKHFTSIDVDIIFAKVKVKGQRKINFDQFVNALAIVAEKKHQTLAELVNTIVASSGPAVSGTKADYVKFHDDKSTYTGVYARGGPTNVEPSKDLSSLLDRSPADIRGNKLGLKDQNDPPLTARMRLPPQSPLSSMSLPGSPALRAVTPAASPAPSFSGMRDPCSDDLLAVFRTFATFGTGVITAQSPRGAKNVEMDGARFAKLCRETGLLGGKLNATSVDLIFSKVKVKGTRKIAFKEFEAAVDLLAASKGVHRDDIRATICASGGPRVNGTHAESVRLHDDKSTYTGVYAKGGPSTVDKRITLESLTDRTNTPVKLHSTPFQ